MHVAPFSWDIEGRALGAMGLPWLPTFLYGTQIQKQKVLTHTILSVRSISRVLLSLLSCVIT